MIITLTRMYLIESCGIIVLVNRNCALKNLSYQLQKGTIVMYIFEDAASNTHEEFSDDYIATHLRGMNNRYFARMCHCQFTTHPLEIAELNRRFDDALSESGISELSISITYDVVFDDQRDYLFNKYMDIDSTELLSSIHDYLEDVCCSNSIVYSVFKQRFRPEPTLRSKYTIEDLYTTGEQ